MSHPLVRASADLLRLQDELYGVEIRSSYLLVHHVPYATTERKVAYGTLICELSTNGEQTIKPADHVVHFAGGLPCDKHGNPLERHVINSAERHQLATDLWADCTFSNKPAGVSDFPADYYDKVTHYITLLAGHAEAIDATATAKVGPVATTEEQHTVFKYLDSMSSRARISHISEKLALEKVAIVGVGGTGSYIFDLIAKTPIWEVHLFDGDVLYAHNAFRAPGAASEDEMREMPRKVEHHQGRYEVLRDGIIAHPYDIDESNIGELQAMTFVFLTMDPRPIKRRIVEQLEAWGIPFVDAGMGVYEKHEQLRGILTATVSTAEHRDHVRERNRITFKQPGEDEYDRNIQIADLNCLNAALAVIAWKKLYGFYGDDSQTHSITYTIATNDLVNEDSAP